MITIPWIARTSDGNTIAGSIKVPDETAYCRAKDLVLTDFNNVESRLDYTELWYFFDDWHIERVHKITCYTFV